MTHRNVLRAQQLCINMRVHINWLHACDAGCGRLACSINSDLSSSAAVQTWINSVINLSFQMYDFSTSISFVPYWLLVPSPSNLCSTPTVLTDPHIAVNCLPFYQSLIWKPVAYRPARTLEVEQTAVLSTTPHQRRMPICIWSCILLQNVRFRHHNMSKCVSVIHRHTYLHTYHVTY